MSASSRVAPTRAGLSHEALLYTGVDGFLATTVPFVRAGIEADEPVLVALPPGRIDALRDALGADADAVRFADMTVMGQNPARIIPAWRDFLDDRAAAGRRRGIGEPIWAGRTDVEVVECLRHEALLNIAFGSGPDWTLLCPYDVATLPDEVIAEAWRSHPVVHHDGAADRSPTVQGAEWATAHLADPLPVPPAGSDQLRFGVDGVRHVRDYVSAHMVAADLDAVRSFDLLIAVSEIATNSLQHGGGQGTVTVWHDAETFVCEVADRGVLDDPLVGRVLPGRDDEGRRGVWLANQLCDLVQIRVFDTGTVVRLHMSLGGGRPVAEAAY